MNLWKQAAKLNKETAYIGSGCWVEPFPCYKKTYFPCLLDHCSTSLFDKKVIQQREISDTLSSVSSEQLEGRTGEVSFNSCLAYYITAQICNCKVCKLQDCKDCFQMCSLQHFLFILSKG